MLREKSWEQKSRGKINIIFEGVKVKKSFIKRLPLRRGKGKFKAGKKPLIVKLGYLDMLPTGSKIDINLLVKHGIAKKYVLQPPFLLFFDLLRIFRFQVSTEPLFWHFSWEVLFFLYSMCLAGELLPTFPSWPWV